MKQKTEREGLSWTSYLVTLAISMNFYRDAYDAVQGELLYCIFLTLFVVHSIPLIVLIRKTKREYAMKSEPFYQRYTASSIILNCLSLAVIVYKVIDYTVNYLG